MLTSFGHPSGAPSCAAVAPDTHFHTDQQCHRRQARLAAFRHMAPLDHRAAERRAGTRAARLRQRGCYRLVHLSRLYLASLAAAWMHAGGGPPHLVLDWTRTTSAPIAALRCCSENGASRGARIGPRRRPMRSWRSGVNTCHARSPACDVGGRGAPAQGSRRRYRHRGDPRRRRLKARRDASGPNAEAGAISCSSAIWAICVHRRGDVVRDTNLAEARSALPFPAASSSAAMARRARSCSLDAGPASRLSDTSRMRAALPRAALAVVPIRAGGGTPSSCSRAPGTGCRSWRHASGPKVQGFARAKSCYWRIREGFRFLLREAADDTNWHRGSWQEPEGRWGGTMLPHDPRGPARQDRYMARKGVRRR